MSLLYEAEMKTVSVREVLGGLAVPPDPYCQELIAAVDSYGTRADRLITEVSLDWAPERMAVVDRLVLRLATCELLSSDSPPKAVVIDEAVELAKVYSTEESGRFVNGILSAIAGRVGEGGSSIT